MKLSHRIQVGYLITLVFSVIVMSFLAYRIYLARSADINGFYAAQVYHISNTIQTLIESVENDVLNFSTSPVVTTPDDSEFTSFLHSDGINFKYKYGPREKAIINLLNSYRKTHLYVNSVYMGRENGSFVRSHPRGRPTKYDPRDRPWYLLAMKDKKSVMITEPYPSVTVNDINIGVVKALVDGNGGAFGVVGADITLEELSSFIGGVKLIKGSYFMLLDGKGIVLTNPNPSRIFKNIADTDLSGMAAVMKSKDGALTVKAGNREWAVFYDTNSRFGWKICAMVPAEVINSEIYGFFWLLIILTVAYGAAGLLIINYFSRKISEPFNALLEEMRNLAKKITETKRFSAITIAGDGEIRDLAETFNIMGEKLAFAYRELDENYEKLKELGRMKSSFISMVSHELRTPLTIIEGAYYLLIKNPVDDAAKRTEMTGIMDFNIKRLQLIVADLIDVSMMEAGRIKLNIAAVDIPTVVGAVIKQISVIAGEKSLGFSFRPTASFQAYVDAARLEQILFNVLGNAVKFSPNGSEVVVSAEKIKGDMIKMPARINKALQAGEYYAIIRVRDSGQGLSEDDITKVFDLFYQASDVTTRKHQGLGVGLSLAQKLVEAHNGLLWAESDGPGKGSEFFILIPVEMKKEGIT